jgi:hypothetical protein
MDKEKGKARGKGTTSSRNMGNNGQKLRVKCIKCGKEWEKDTVIPWGPDDYTSSFCNACFRELISHVIHRKQRKEGNFDCFGKARVYCDQFACRYRELCFLRVSSQENVKVNEVSR